MAEVQSFILICSREKWRFLAKQQFEFIGYEILGNKIPKYSLGSIHT